MTKPDHGANFYRLKYFPSAQPSTYSPKILPPESSVEEEPIAEAIDTSVIAKELAALKPVRKVTSRGAFDVYVAPIHEIPQTMMEIGRLREITFRNVGEGTGKPRDIDEYDLYYLQLLIWDREAQKIVGGYRLGQGDVIFKRFGINGFYASSLFKIEEGFYPVMQQSIELGRSYVVDEYQRHRLPLFLLWKGILFFLLANPHYRYLYGPVSISKYYSEVSKSVIIEFVKQYYFDETMAQYVQPRKPFRLKSRTVNTKIIAENLRGEFDALEDFVEKIEPKHFSVPVLFRQYLRQSAKFVAFNVDPKFSDCLDGLMVLDISKLPESTMEILQQEK
ncbi:MAG: GNAT family N-acetyltransferase [Lewinellaceae bacterium]|nr:GNAT family N-acetyltransferase [Lewinellaceae bacterium]